MKYILQKINSLILARVVAISLCGGVTALVWDAWWHIAVGRDTFWEPPHLVLYSSVIVALLAGLLGWWTTKEAVWKKLAIATLLVPLSAPFDNAWHNFFGVENLNTILIIWSPPHLFLFGALIAGILMSFMLLRQDSESVRLLLGSYAWGCILAMSAIVAAPFYPFGPYHIWRFAGAGVLTVILTSFPWLHPLSSLI